MRFYKLCFPLLISGLIACQDVRYDPPKSPNQTIASFDIISGFEIDLFATEPHVQDPVDMTIDEQGRVFVVEMHDYPYKPEPGKARGRIKQLFDTNDDGVIDSAAVFLDGISEATSVLPWRKGLLIAAAPHILYSRDLDGDGKSDSTEVLFTGFFENNSEAQITNLKFGINNWIYASNNGQGGKIRFLKNPKDTLELAGGDFRFRLDRGLFENVAGPAQFGQAFNDRGHRFTTHNTIHLRHAVIPWRYLHRHPHLSSYSGSHQNISDHELEMFQETPPPHWRAERTRQRQKSYEERGLDQKEYAEDHFTGCSGGTFYAGNNFPKNFYGSIFTGEVAGNLIHRDVLQSLADQPTYVASRSASERDREFLSSTDSWFRPTHFYVGPEGFLYVVDFYRQHIETPLSIPEDLKADMDFMNGMDMGRIYRIKSQNTNRTNQASTFSGVDKSELVRFLGHPNRWHRLQAQRLILEKQDTDLIPLLQAFYASQEFDLSRLHAFYALEGLGAMDQDLVLRAIKDPYPGLREHGAMMAEGYPGLIPHLIENLKDNDLRVIFQTCLSLGQFQNDKRVENALLNVLQTYESDPFFRTAILSSLPGSSLTFFDHLLESIELNVDLTPGIIDFIREFGYVAAMRNSGDERNYYLDRINSQNISFSKSDIEDIVAHFFEGIEKSKDELIVSQQIKTAFEILENAVDSQYRNLIEKIKNEL